VAALAFAACATLGPKEHEDLRAFGACGGTPRLRDDVERAMRWHRLSMPDAVLAFELITGIWEGHNLLPPAEADFLRRTGWIRDAQYTVSVNDYPRFGHIRRCLTTRYGYRFAVER
jgi:hypothetical protein